MNCCSTHSVGQSTCSTEAASRREARRPAIDILESPSAYTITADVPGATHESTELHLDKGILRVTARAALPGEGIDYQRAFAMPDSADLGSISAEVQNGVLTIRIPKAASAQPRRIPVNTN